MNELLLVAGMLVLACVPVVLVVRDSHRDVTWLLTVYLVLLVAIPAEFVIGPLGGLGTPAMLVAFGACALWVTGRFVPTMGMPLQRQPVGIALVPFVAWTIVTYVVAFLRPLTALEASEADRTLLTFLALSGVAALAADGIRSFERLDTLLKRIVGAGAFMALLGVLQFFGLDLVSRIDVPGLTLNAEVHSVLSRSIFNRPASTTMHPIEFSVVGAVILPLALHYALYTYRRSGRWLVAVAGFALIAASIPMTVSRSGMLAAAVALLTLSFAWTWRRRINLLVLGVVFFGLMRAAVPGLLGTLRNLFLNASDDPSIQGRTEDIGVVVSFVRESPIVGRGLGTYTSDLYTLLDNQIYVTTIESGLVGLFVTMFLVVVSMVACIRTGLRAGRGPTRHLAFALAGAIAAATVAMATFDAFFYRIYLGLLFMLIGCAGAFWRLRREVPSAVADVRQPRLATAAARSGTVRDP